MALAFHRPGFGCSYGQYGDDLGNIRRLIAPNLQALDNAFPAAKKIAFDVATGRFLNADNGRPVEGLALRERVRALRSSGASGGSSGFSGGGFSGGGFGGGGGGSW